MSGVTTLERPNACSAAARADFARLVRRGFAGSDEGLDCRIEAAERLAFHRTADGMLAAIAALKAPDEGYRQSVFERAAGGADPDDYELELGWVYVEPAHRRRGLATSLCRQLLDAAPAAGVFATTRPDNAAMIGVLVALGFAPAGKPFPHVRRGEQLALLLRPPP